MDIGFSNELRDFGICNDYKRFLRLVTPEITIAYPDLVNLTIRAFRGDEPELIDALFAIFGRDRCCAINPYTLVGKPRMLTAFLRYFPNFVSGQFANDLLHWPKTFLALYESIPVSRNVIIPPYFKL